MRHLKIGLTSIKKKDSSPVRQQLFSDFLRTKRFVLIVLKLLPNRAAALLAPFYGFLRLLAIDCSFSKNPALVAVYQYDNEIRCITSRSQESPDSFIRMGRYRLKNFAHLILLLSFKNLKLALRIWKLSSYLIFKNGLLVGTRQSQFLVLYCYFKNFLIKSHTNLGANSKFIVSSESNPDTIATTLAAQSLGYKTVFIPHGFLDTDLGLFFHDIIIYQGAELLKRIQPSLISNSQSLIAVGPYFKKRPMKFRFDAIKKVGIVCSLSPDLKILTALIQEILQSLPKVFIEVRLHPNRTFHSNLNSCVNNFVGNVKFVDSVDWQNAELDWDLAFVGNSSAHLDVLNLGIPTTGFKLDLYEHDRYGFYKNGLVPFLKDLDGFELVLTEFYNRPVWKEVLENYLPEQVSKIDLSTVGASNVFETKIIKK